VQICTVVIFSNSETLRTKSVFLTVLIYQCLWVCLNNFLPYDTHINFENAKGEGTTDWCLMCMLNV